MTARARRSSANAFEYGEFDADQNYGHWELLPEERVAPAGARGGKALLRGIVFILIALGGAWWQFGDPATWPGRLLAETAALSSMLDSKAPGPVIPAPAALSDPLPASS